MNLQTTNFACNLTVLSEREREQFASDTHSIFAAVKEIHEFDNGFAFRFPKTSGQLAQIAEFVERESQCCSFLHFTLEVEPSNGPVWLHITGKEGTKQFLQAELDQLKIPNFS